MFRALVCFRVFRVFRDFLNSIMKKNEIADVLTQIGTLLELRGENPFKVRAYGSGARALEAPSSGPEGVRSPRARPRQCAVRLLVTPAARQGSRFRPCRPGSRPWLATLGGRRRP